MDSTEELKNENPAFLTEIFANVSELFANYGWFMLIGGVASVYIYYQFYRNYLENYWKRKSEDEYAAKYHKNPDLLQSRMSAMEEARKKMQEKLNKDAEEYKLKQQLKEEKKRQELLDKYKNSSGIKLGNGKQSEGEEKKSLRTDYNPLAGSASGSSYRAPKRSACGGGGCGK